MPTRGMCHEYHSTDRSSTLPSSYQVPGMRETTQRVHERSSVAWILYGAFPLQAWNFKVNRKVYFVITSQTSHFPKRNSFLFVFGFGLMKFIMSDVECESQCLRKVTVCYCIVLADCVFLCKIIFLRMYLKK